MNKCDVGDRKTKHLVHSHLLSAPSTSPVSCLYFLFVVFIESFAIPQGSSKRSRERRFNSSVPFSDLDFDVLMQESYQKPCCLPARQQWFCTYQKSCRFLISTKPSIAAESCLLIVSYAWDDCCGSCVQILSVHPYIFCRWGTN